MSGAMTPDSPARRTVRRPGIGVGIIASARGLAFCGLMLAATGLLLVLAAAAVLTGLGVGILIVGNGAPTGQRVLLGLLVTGAGLGIGWFGIPAALLALRLAGRSHPAAGVGVVRRAHRRHWLPAAARRGEDQRPAPVRVAAD